MEIITVLRILRRRRGAVAVGMVLALAIGIAVALRPASITPVAWTTVILDTKPSQVVTPAPAGADTLGWRAELLGDLMLTDSIRAAIAKRLRLQPSEVAVIEPDLNIPASPTALPRRASEATATAEAPNVVTVTTNDQLATITFVATAPDHAGVVRLAKATRDELRAAVDATAAAAPRPDPTLAPEDVIWPQSYEVTGGSTIESDEIRSARGPLMGGVAAVAMATLWAFATVLFPTGRLRRRARRARRARRPRVA